MSRIIVCIILMTMLAACAPAGVGATPSAPSTSPTGAVTSSPGNGTDTTPSGSANPYQPQAGDAQLKRGNVFIDTAQIMVLESYPPQYRLSITGWLPTPCHQLRLVVGQPDANNRIDVDAYSVYDAGTVCVQMTKAFEASLNLDGFAAGKYSVWLNGKSVGEIDVAAPLEGHSMKGWEIYSWQVDGMWYYSLLVGTNRNKTYPEVTNPNTRLADVSALEGQLAGLVKGEFVFWGIRGDIAGLSLPPEEVIADIRAYCARQGLELTVAP